MESRLGIPPRKSVLRNGASWWIDIHLDDPDHCGYYCPQITNPGTVPYCDCFQKVLEKEDCDGLVDLVKRLPECLKQEVVYDD